VDADLGFNITNPLPLGGLPFFKQNQLAYSVG
jgi:hypothetical protein